MKLPNEITKVSLPIISPPPKEHSQTQLTGQLLADCLGSRPLVLSLHGYWVPPP